MSSTANRFSAAIAAFDAYHQNDPNMEEFQGGLYPKELLYAMRMTEQLFRLAPDADEIIRLAARCQHIGRWEIPRQEFPMDRKGYLRWRNAEKAHHAAIAGKILDDCGYDPETIAAVKTLLLKKGLQTDAGTQLLEDVACLVFMEYYLADFAVKHDDDKVVDILRKTLRKMSDTGKTVAGSLKLPDSIRPLVQRAVTTSG